MNFWWYIFRKIYGIVYELHELFKEKLNNRRMEYGKQIKWMNTFFFGEVQ